MLTKFKFLFTFHVFIKYFNRQVLWHQVQSVCLSESYLPISDPASRNTSWKASDHVSRAQPRPHTEICMEFWVTCFIMLQPWQVPACGSEMAD